MQIVVESQQGRIAVVQLKGRLDLLAAATVKQKLAEAVSSSHNKLVVNLRDVEFIDSSGLGALIGGLKASRIAGGDLRIAAPQEQARYILQVSTLDRVLHPYASVEEALSGYA